LVDIVVAHINLNDGQGPPSVSPAILLKERSATLFQLFSPTAARGRRSSKTSVKCP
jgi:hypothetical protein